MQGENVRKNAHFGKWTLTTPKRGNQSMFWEQMMEMLVES